MRGASRCRRRPARLLAALVLAGLGRCAEAAAAWRTRYMIISSPNTSNIYYTRLPSFHDFTLPVDERRIQSGRLLIDGAGSRCTGYGCSEDSDAGLISPGAVAVYEAADMPAVLYVADTGAKKIYAYRIEATPWDWIIPGPQRRVRRQVTALGLATDSQGNLFYTTGEPARVEMIPAAALVVARARGEDPLPVLLYPAGSPRVAGPAGIATDSFFLYWANTAGDDETGCVVKASDGGNGSVPHPIAANSDRYEAVAANVCVARDTIFFTGGTPSLFAVKSLGGTIAEVTSNFSAPKGCVYDEASTLYVADEGRNAIYSLAANFASLRTIRYVTLVAEVPHPSHLAIFGDISAIHYSVAARSGASGVVSALLLSAALLLIP